MNTKLSLIHKMCGHCFQLRGARSGHSPIYPFMNQITHVLFWTIRFHLENLQVESFVTFVVIRKFLCSTFVNKVLILKSIHIHNLFTIFPVANLNATNLSYLIQSLKQAFTYVQNGVFIPELYGQTQHNTYF